MQRHIESQRNLASAICEKYGEGTISHTTIQKIENKTGNPTWDTIRVLCDYFHVDPYYLLGITDTEEEAFNRKIKCVLLELFDHGDASYIRNEIKDEVREYIQDCCDKDWNDSDIRIAVAAAIVKRFKEPEKLRNVLDDQAKDDLLLLYKDIDNANIEKKDFFWSVLECAGCFEEFERYKEGQGC